jgi:tetratricopeptide (TPR) repeat protein
MAKTKPKQKSQSREKSVLNRTTVPSNSKANTEDAASLLLKATTKLQQGDIEGAVPFATKALQISGSNSIDALPALNLLGEIHVELGDIDAAKLYFTQAVQLDADGKVDGAEKFMWLAQLSEEGGADSVSWFEKGVAVLRRDIQTLVDKSRRSEDEEALLEEKRRKLATALCGVVEVYMTDLSWEADAEQKCESLVTEATILAPSWAESWQTLANVRLSQDRKEDARAALTRSLDLWKDLTPEDERVPDFPTRVSLARLLMEAEMEEEAIEVLERLVGEDDSSVEVWYLGGWGLYIMGEKQKNGEVKDKDGDGESWKISWISSRQWLTHGLRLFEQQEYEDERLGEHAKELVAILNKELGGEMGEDEEEGEDWEEEEEEEGSDDDEEMGEA